jgi:hypothetical protein
MNAGSHWEWLLLFARRNPASIDNGGLGQKPDGISCVLVFNPYEAWPGGGSRIQFVAPELSGVLPPLVAAHAASGQLD